MNPPLRTPDDVAACIDGLRDGTIDCIATDHAPHAVQDKLCEFDDAAFGISGLETAFGLSCAVTRRSPLETLIRALTIGAGARPRPRPARRRASARCRAGAPADVVLIDPEAEWTVEPETLRDRRARTRRSPASRSKGARRRDGR